MAKYDESTLSDLYKDAFGFRPGPDYRSRWEAMTESERDAEWDGLLWSVEDSMTRDREEQARAVRSYRKGLADMMELGAPDEAAAKRWFLDSVNLAGEPDPGYVCFSLGLPYSMESEFRGG
jgi:hypothetical protein